MSPVAKSKKMLATVKPMNWKPAPSPKFITVAIKPIRVIDPSFLIHQVAKMSTENPIKSHKNGRPNMRKKIGAKRVFNTPHKVAHIDIAAISFVVKYATSLPSGNTIFKDSNTISYLNLS